MTALLNPLKQMLNPSLMRQIWPTLKAVPGGGRIMGGIIGRMAPYTGTIRPEVVSLDIGYARIRMADRRAVRNHLDCVHAIALMNLGEVATGLAMLYSLPEGMRGIIKGLSMEYLKKARGPIIGECLCQVPQTLESREFEVVADLKNESGDLVARAVAKWLVGPIASGNGDR